MLIKRDNESNQASKRSRTVTDASNFVFEMQLEAIDSLVDDWVWILPAKEGKVLLEFGKVGSR